MPIHDLLIPTTHLIISYSMSPKYVGPELGKASSVRLLCDVNLL